MSEHILAIDFGTSYSNAAVVIPGRGVEIVAISGPAHSTSMWPSAVYLDDGRLLAGWDADTALINGKDPKFYSSAFKRALGEGVPIPLGEKTYRPEQLVTVMLAEVKAAAENFARSRIRRAVLTVPASYPVGGRERALMIAAAEEVGLDPVELLPEPLAAAYAPEVDRIEPGKLVLVYDFGGGTFDAALIMTGPEFVDRPIDFAANKKCGGIDLDRELIVKLSEDPRIIEWQQKVLSQTSESDLPEMKRRLLEGYRKTARDLKHLLSERKIDATRSIMRSAPPSTLSPGDLEAAAKSLMKDTIECCQTLIARQRNLAIADIDYILLVGGTTRMPTVAKTLREAFDRPLLTVSDPDLLVVRGAAEWASKREIKTLMSYPAEVDTCMLRWQNDSALLLRWHVAPGDEFRAESALARVRFSDGSVWDYTASKAGRMVEMLVTDNCQVKAGDWIAVTASR